MKWRHLPEMHVLKGLPPNFRLYVKLDASSMTKPLRELTDLVHHLLTVGGNRETIAQYR